jgi:N-acetyl-gamma-glutamylphosphate reductase
MSRDAQIPVSTGSKELLEVLGKHPRLLARLKPEVSDSIEINQEGWIRTLRAGIASGDTFGLIELMDNNPIVCATDVSVPLAADCAAIAAIGPLAEAGILLQPPVISSTADFSPSFDGWLETVNWTGGATLNVVEADVSRGIHVTVMALIQSPEHHQEIDDLYDERYGRSFFIRRDETSVWAPELVQNQPYMTYRLRWTPDVGSGLLTVQLMGDRDGKFGFGGMVHALNVMLGFEESLGLI